jgi:DNA helicase-2/ATP-dependent DNA helicase PcrA
VERIAHLIRHEGAHPEEILAVTFTNKAAGEMASRVAELLGGDVAPPTWIATFHSACARLLRREAHRIGISRSFTIFDDDDQRRMLKVVAKELNVPSDRGSLGAYQQFIERARNQAMLPDAAHESGVGPNHELLANVFEAYHHRMRRNGTLDFGDLIQAVIDLLEHDERTRQYYQTRWPYLLVDEFQDTNPAQYKLLRLLVGAARDITVVGDDDQSIYSWRGATIENILGFESAFPGCRVVRLEQNYRSTQAILNVANQVIADNSNRQPKELWTERAGGELPIVFTGRDDREEAHYIARTIERLLSEAVRPSEIAVFYRTNAQSRNYEEALRRYNIDYRVIAGTSFYAREEVKDLLAYLRVAANPDDLVAATRIVNVPRRGCGEKTLERIRSFALSEGIPFFEALERFVADPPTRLRRATRDGLEELCEIVNELSSAANGQAPSEMALWLLEQIDYRKHLESKHAESATDRYDNVVELISAMRAFEEEVAGVAEEATLAGFLERSALVQATDVVQGRGAVSLMTIHAAKGLEYPIVFLTGLEEGLLPLRRHGAEDVDDVEEERRLCYVAMTRAEEQLYLTNCLHRRIYGNLAPRTASRFLDAIESVLLKVDPAGAASRHRFTDTLLRDLRSSARPGRDASVHYEYDAVPHDGIRLSQPSRDDSELGKLIGRNALHKTFGSGVVTNAEYAGQRIKLTIRFRQVGTKKVIRSFVEIV